MAQVFAISAAGVALRKVRFCAAPKTFAPLYDRLSPPSCPPNYSGLDVLSPADHAGSIVFGESTSLEHVLAEKPILAKMAIFQTTKTDGNRPQG